MKRKMAISIIAITILCSVSLFCMQGCLFILSALNDDSDYVKTDINEGFQYENSLGRIIVAAKSDTNVFDISDVTIDFYYGITEGGLHDDDVALCTYLCDSKRSIPMYVEEYKTDFAGAVFLDEKTRDELINGPFDVKIEWKALLGEPNYFRFKKTLTIPEEMLRENNALYYAVVFFSLIEEVDIDRADPEIDIENMNYMLANCIFIELTQETVDENTVKIEARRTR